MPFSCSLSSNFLSLCQGHFAADGPCLMAEFLLNHTLALTFCMLAFISHRGRPPVLKLPGATTLTFLKALSWSYSSYREENGLLSLLWRWQCVWPVLLAIQCRCFMEFNLCDRRQWFTMNKNWLGWYSNFLVDS